jgi:hypothetical protein
MGQKSSPARVLIVAHQTADSLELRAAVAERAAEGPCLFTLLVPTSPPDIRRLAEPGDHGVAAARRRLDVAVPILSTIADGAVVGMIGSHDPLTTVQDALKLLGFDEVIVSMLPARISTWLRVDLPSKIRNLGVPVTEVVNASHGIAPLPAA